MRRNTITGIIAVDSKLVELVRRHFRGSKPSNKFLKELWNGLLRLFLVDRVLTVLELEAVVLYFPVGESYPFLLVNGMRQLLFLLLADELTEYMQTWNRLGTSIGQAVSDIELLEQFERVDSDLSWEEEHASLCWYLYDQSIEGKLLENQTLPDKVSPVFKASEHHQPIGCTASNMKFRTPALLTDGMY